MDMFAVVLLRRILWGWLGVHLEPLIVNWVTWRRLSGNGRIITSFWGYLNVRQVDYGDTYLCAGCILRGDIL